MTFIKSNPKCLRKKRRIVTLRDFFNSLTLGRLPSFDALSSGEEEEMQLLLNIGADGSDADCFSVQQFNDGGIHADEPGENDEIPSTNVSYQRLESELYRNSSTSTHSSAAEIVNLLDSFGDQLELKTGATNCAEVSFKPSPDQYLPDTRSNSIVQTTDEELSRRSSLESSIRQCSLKLRDDLSAAAHVHRHFELYEEECLNARGTKTLKQWMLDSNQYLPNRVAVLHQLFQMVRELHNANVPVGNLSPEAITFCYKDHLWKLASLRGAACIQVGVIPTCCNAHAAPEVTQARENGDLSRVGKPADMWSLGVIILELVTGKEHHGVHGKLEGIDKYIHEEISALNKEPVDSDALGTLLENLLCLDPNERLTIEQVFKSRFFHLCFPQGCVLQQTRNRTLRRIRELRLTGAMLAEHVKVKLALKLFRRKNDPGKHFYERRTWPACDIIDDWMPSDPVYIQRAEEKTLLAIYLESDIPFEAVRIEDVSIVAENEERPVTLKAETVKKTMTSLKSVALLDPEVFASGILSRASKGFGSLEQKYTKLVVEFTVVNNEVWGNFRLSRAFYVKVIGRRAMLFFDRLPCLYRQTIGALPQWMRSIGKGAAFCSGLIP